MILMKQAEVLAKAGLIESTIRKYHDALRCDPNHRDGYHYLSRALTSVGKYDEAVALLGRRPEPLKNDVGLMEQSAFIVQNRPSPKGADAKAQIAWRSQQRAVAKTMWLEIARRAPKRLMAWLNLAESALLDGSGPGRAKAYFNQALKHHPNMTRKARVRQLKDRIDRAIKPDTTIPAIELKPPTAVDAGPNQDGGPP
jgi:predicted Zn-dependent protease